jgi:hypothetical protein
MNPCVSCGQPTTAGDTCAFCRLVERVNQHLAEEESGKLELPANGEME